MKESMKPAPNVASCARSIQRNMHRTPALQVGGNNEVGWFLTMSGHGRKPAGKPLRVWTAEQS